jgi:hypothetical protein
MTRRVVLSINEQQAQVIDRLVAGKQLGADRAEVILAGFKRFCETHPEMLRADHGDSPSDDNDQAESDGPDAR